MRFRFITLLIISGFLLLHGCKNVSKDKLTVQGSFANLPDARLYLYQILPASKPLIDSVNTDNKGNFSISFQVKKPAFYSLRRNLGDEITLVILPGENIKIGGNGNSMLDSYSVEGSENSALFADYSHFTTANLKQVDSLSRIFAESRNRSDFQEIKTGLDTAYLQIFNHQKEKVISFVTKHPNSLASLLVISSDFGPNPLLSEHSHPDLFLKLDSTLIRSFPENSLVTAFHLRMLDFQAEMGDMELHDKLLKPGMPAPEISLPDATGKERKLSSLKGKLTLVYFWSSWDAKSRQVNMNLTSLYSRYHDRGFEIYAVSIDSDADLWQKAFRLDKAYWMQVNDAKGLGSDYSKTYGVRALPKMILVGKDGKIIAGNPVFGELDGLVKNNL
ncbi:MAG: TlpA disulfide reductase family protein [Bacteroidota bacterium]